MKTTFLIALTCVMIVAGVVVSSDLFASSPVSDTELATIRGARECCTRYCVFKEKKCGFYCWITWLPNDLCEDGSDCNWNDGLGWYGDKCEEDFMDRKTCEGDWTIVSTGAEKCDNFATSEDCGGWGLCLFAYTDCLDGHCECVGVGLCGGIPWVTQCGSFATCEGPYPE